MGRHLVGPRALRPISDGVVVRQVEAWEHECILLTFEFLTDTDFALDDIDAEREGVEFDTDGIVYVDSVLA